MYEDIIKAFGMTSEVKETVQEMQKSRESVTLYNQTFCNAVVDEMISQQLSFTCKYTKVNELIGYWEVIICD